MRAVVQRVDEAAVLVDGRVVGEIGRGLLVLLGVAGGDGSREAEILAEKLVGLRIFPDGDGKMNRSVVDVDGSVLLVSQFTLHGDVRRGRRPSFTDAASPEVAAPLVAETGRLLESHGVPVATGEFGARMEVRLVNNGPVTLVINVIDGKVR
jgi:D-tyrosyl-tRNA(Tyr) deacylase